MRRHRLHGTYVAPESRTKFIIRTELKSNGNSKSPIQNPQFPVKDLPVPYSSSSVQEPCPPILPRGYSPRAPDSCPHGAYDHSSAARRTADPGTDAVIAGDSIEKRPLGPQSPHGQIRSHSRIPWIPDEGNIPLERSRNRASGLTRLLNISTLSLVAGTAEFGRIKCMTEPGPGDRPKVPDRQVDSFERR
jgi:hypothetical protein